jgi:SAM-dependent methyltransferase
MDLDAYRLQSRETWGQMASGWETRREWLTSITAGVNDWLTDKADPQRGQTVLDIAAGPGSLGLGIAERVGPEGRVLLTDFAPEMVDVARRQGEARGLTNVDFRVLDAERMDLEDDSFDAVVCRFGYMLMADPALALRETRRVLRDGGPLAFAVWGTPDRNPWLAAPGMTLVQRGHMPPPEPGAPGVFAMGDPSRIRELVTAAGFGDPELAELEMEYVWPDADDMWESHITMSGPFSRVIKGLPDDEHASVREAILENMERFRVDGGSIRAPGMAVGVLVR